MMQSLDQKILNKLNFSKRISISIFFFISGFNFATWVSRIPALQQKFLLNNAELGSLLASIPIGIMVTMPFVGYVLVKYKSSTVLFFCSIFYTLLLSSLAFINTKWQLFIVLFLFGASRNFFNSTINTQSLLVQRENQKSVLTLFHAVWSLAALVGTGLSYLAIGYNLSIQLHFLIVSFISLITILIFFRYAVVNEEIDKKYSFMWPSKLLLKLGLIGFITMLCESTMSDWSSNYFLQVLQLPSEYSVIGYAVYVSAVLTGRFVGDYFISKFGIYIIIQFSVVLFTIGFTGTYIFSYVPVVVLSFFLIGIGLSCMMPSVFGLVSKLSIHPPGISVAIVTAFSYAGFLLGPPIIGFIAHQFNIRISFLFLSLLSFLLVLLLPLLLKNARNQ